MDSAQQDVATGEQSTSSTRRAAAATLTVVVIAASALFLGGMTSPAQQYLPQELSSFANSAGGWTALTFALIWLTRTRPGFAAVLGVVAFVLLVEGYRLVSEWRGYPYGQPFQGIFTYIGIVTGPIVGATAGLLRYGRQPWKTLAVAPVAAVLVGEGLYGVTVIADTTSPVYWWLQIAAGIAFTGFALFRQKPGIITTIATVAITALGAGAFHLAYQAVGTI